MKKKSVRGWTIFTQSAIKPTLPGLKTSGQYSNGQYSNGQYSNIRTLMFKFFYSDVTLTPTDGRWR